MWLIRIIFKFNIVIIIYYNKETLSIAMSRWSKIFNYAVNTQKYKSQVNISIIFRFKGIVSEKIGLMKTVFVE